MYNDFELKVVNIPNGEKIGYRVCGKGDNNLLLIHGNMSSSKHWDIFMEELKEDYKIYAVDLRGFGASSYNNPINSLFDFAKDVNDFCEAVDLKSFVVIGWSTGGGVALELAANYSEKVEKVVLVESVGPKGYPMFKKDEKGQATGILMTTKEEIAKDPVQVLPVLVALENKNKELYRMIWNMSIYTNNKPNEEKYEEYLDDMLTQRNLVDVDYALVHFNMTDENNGINLGSDTIKNVMQPILIIQGDRDYVVPMYMAEELNKHLKNSKLQILNDCGHSPLVDCLDRLVFEVKEFVGCDIKELV